MSQRDAFNDSIIMGNVGAHGQMDNIELDFEPQDVIDTEFVDTAPPTKSRKKLFLALAVAGVVITGGLLTQVSSVQNLFGGPQKPLDLVAIEAQEPIISGNPFAAMPDAGKAPVDVASNRVSTTTVATDVAPDAAGVAKGSAEELLLAQGTGDTPVEDIEKVEAAAKAAEEKIAAERAAAAAEKAKAEQAEKERLAKEKAEKERLAKKKLEQDKAKKEKAEKERIAKEGVSEKRGVVAKKQGSETQAKEEVVREVMTVTAEQIGLRAFTQGKLVVNAGGQVATYRVNDHLPSGERIERIDASVMTVVTDRSVIRVKD